MSFSMTGLRNIEGWPRLIILGIVGAVLGWSSPGLNFLTVPVAGHVVPLPYRVAKIPGGTALRLAMVHDVLHERYLTHGAAWYAQRNKLAQQIMDRATKNPATQPSEEYLSAMDDLAVGLQRTGRIEPAIALMRRKLSLLPPLPAMPSTHPFVDSKYAGYQEQDRTELNAILAAEHLSATQQQQYNACANLGTLLILANMHSAMTSDTVAKQRMREGLDYIRHSIAINPGAHFGREKWQAILVEHLLACTEHPKLLLDDDFIGVAWDGIAILQGLWIQDQQIYGMRFRSGRSFSLNLDPEPPDRIKIRQLIRRPEVDADWLEMVQPEYAVNAPFDEPALAILGMWTMGGGPNPHFALALGQIMEGANQFAIAWNAYERAIGMKDQFWPDPAVCAKFVDLCKQRQHGIAQVEFPSDPAGWQQRIRQVHRDELAWGQAYQTAYHDYEAKQIASGVRLDDPKFYDAFFAGRPPIASDVGDSDDLIVIAGRNPLPPILLGAGLLLAYGVLVTPKPRTVVGTKS
jgi:hypothetical protein